MTDNHVRVGTQTSTPPRKCTDVAFLVLLVLMTIADIAIIAAALFHDPPPNPEYLTKGHDYNGDICHTFTAWLDFDHHHITECVDSCAEVTTYEPMEFENYWCVPKDKEVRAANHFEFSHASDTYLRMLGDLYIVWPLVLVMALMSIPTSLLYLYMIKIHRRLTAYIIMNIVFGLLGGILLVIHGYEDAIDPLTDYTGNIEIAFGVFNLCLVLIIALRLRYEREALETEIEMMAEAIETITNLWTAVLFCCLYSIWVLMGFAAWIVAALYIYSVPEFHQHNTPADMMDVMKTDIVGKYTEIEVSNYKYLLIYHLIFAVHLMFVACYFGYLVVSHVILVWYLEKDNETSCWVRWPPNTATHVEDMSTQQIIQWIEAEMDDEYHDIVRLLINVIKDKEVTGARLYDVIKDKEVKEAEEQTRAAEIANSVHYTVLKGWLTQQDVKGVSVTTTRIEEVSDAFFKLVRKRLENEKKGPTQWQIVWNAWKTIRFYHIGTAALAAWLSLLGVMDIYPLLYAYLRKRKCCAKDDDDTDARAASRDIEMDVMISSDIKDAMYKAYKQKITPLIMTKIKNLSKEYMLSAAVDKTMTNITSRYYDLAVGISTGAAQSFEDEPKPDTKEAEKIFAAIDDNIDQFQNEIEEEIKSDIYKIIDRNIDNYKFRKEMERTGNEDEKDGRHVTSLDTEYLGMIRKEGLIFTSLYGTSFVRSSYDASYLEKANITRLADVQGFSAYNERFGRIGIACTNTAVAVTVMFIYDEINHNISSFVMPAFIMFLISYTIGYIFTSILEVTVSTLLFCVILNEEKWNELFSINQGKVKQNVGGLANSLSAMITEHQLIMQLKDTAVNAQIRKIVNNEKVTDEQIEKIREKRKIIESSINDEKVDRVQDEEIRKIMNAENVNRLMDAKRRALRTEEQLLQEIDGPMKLTQYLIDVILVENYFNKQYKKDKPEQERARAEYAQHIFDEKKYENKRISFKQRMYDTVVRYPKIESFLRFYPNDETEDKQITDTWKRIVEDLGNELRDKAHILKFTMGKGQKKGIERAFYKSFYTYHDKEDGFRYLTDVLRCSIKFVDFEHLYRAFQYIHEEMTDTLEILRVKDTFNSPSEPNGYRHLMINVLVRGEEVLEGIICEIQLHHQTFYEAKRVSHRMYKKTRLFDTEHGNEAYKYAVKYVRPVIGRFKVYPMHEEQDQIDILDMIGEKLERLASNYCKDVIMPSLEPNQSDIVKENIDTGSSMLATVSHQH